MSVKAMGLVWDLECHQKINGLEFKPNHKFVLISYADHADHHGKNIWPSMKTIAEKTGLDERTVQRMTRDLEAMGLLIDDGQGPRGTNRWSLPLNERGDRLTPVPVDSVTGDSLTGDKNKKSLGDNSSGDNSLGDSVPDECMNPLTNNNISIYITEVWDRVLKQLKTEFPKAQFETWIECAAPKEYDGETLTVYSRNTYMRDWLENHITTRAQEISGMFIKFAVTPVTEEEPA